MTSKRQLRRRRNDWGFDNVERQKFQQTKAGPEVIPNKKKKSKKDNFCKKNGGDKHQVKNFRAKEIVSTLPDWFWNDFRCVHCGKTFWGSFKETKYAEVYNG